MHLNIANKSTMCSTLILGGLTQSSLKNFVLDLKRGIPLIEAKTEEGYCREYWSMKVPSVKDDHGHELYPCMKYERKVLDNFKVSDFAFVMATTQTDQTHFMAEFGFKNVGKEYNSKNHTTVTLWTMSAREFLEVLAKYDAEGNLIEKEVETSCAA